MAKTKNAVLTAWLSPTPCTPEMREKVVALASERNKSIAEIQREAMSLFLSTLDSKAISNEMEAESI